MEEDSKILYKGEIIDLIQQEGTNLYLSTKKGFVYCVDEKERKILWSFQADEELESPVYIGQNNIYVYDTKTNLYCLDKSGKLNWKKKIEERITSGIEENSGKIYFGTRKGTLYAFDLNQRKKIWSFQAKKPIYSSPVIAEGMIIFGCDDHYLYFLDEKGKVLDKFQTGDKIRGTALVKGNLIYFGSDDHYFYCLGLKKRKKKWKVKTGGKIPSSPVIYKKKIFFLCWSGVLYCLNRKNGIILWWKTLPSRSYYQLAVINDKVVVSSLSSLLVCFDINTGKKVGDYKAGQEIQSNPVWLDPFLLVNLYDFRTGEGSLILLKKKVKVKLKASKKSPQEIGEEIVFRASAIGFYKPEYEFYIKEGKEEKIVQEKSERMAWVWYPEKEGTYQIGVRALDEREKAQAKISYIIQKKMDKNVENLILFLMDLIKISIGI